MRPILQVKDWDPLQGLSRTQLQGFRQEAESWAEEELVRGSSRDHLPNGKCWCLLPQNVQCGTHYCHCFTCDLGFYYPNILLPYFLFKPYEHPGVTASWDEIIPYLTRTLRLSENRHKTLKRVYLKMKENEWNSAWIRNKMRVCGIATLTNLHFYMRMAGRAWQEKKFMKEIKKELMALKELLPGESREFTPENLSKAQGILRQIQEKTETHLEEFCMNSPNLMPHRSAMLLNHHLYQKRYKTVSSFWPRNSYYKVRTLTKLLTKVAPPKIRKRRYPMRR